MDNVRPLSAALQQAAIEQLHETPERIAADIEQLRTWIQQQPHLRARTDAQFLLAFLRGCKFSLEKAKNKIDRFYTLRTKYPDYFACNDVDDRKVRELVNFGILLILPTPLNGDGPRISIMRSGTYPADKYPIEDVSHFVQLMQEILLMDDDYATVHGLVYVIDLAAATKAHLLHMTPSAMKKMSVFSEQALPLRPKQSHFVKAPSSFEAIFNMIKPMLSKKQQSRVSVHGEKIDALYKHIPQKYLPVEYGGENGTIQSSIDYCNQKLDEYREYFKANDAFGTDEKLRPGKPIDFENMFGVAGSFRKLEVD